MHAHKQPLTINESDFRMDSLKYIEIAPVNTKRLQIAFNEANCIAQLADENIQAASHDIKMLLDEPDSVWLREHIKTLCELIEHNSFDAMNTVNSFAVNVGAHYLNKKSCLEVTVNYAALRPLGIQATLP